MLFLPLLFSCHSGEPPAEDGPASLLFVVAASSATVAKTEDGHTLSFELSALTSSIAFTDRPQRRAFDLTIPALATMWDEGDNSFADDPPNAVLKDSGSK